MNDIFHPIRFSFLFKKTVLERPVQVFGIVLLNFVVVLLMYAFLRDIVGWTGTQNLTFIWGLIFGGCYLSAAVFSYFSSNARGSSYLTLPASYVEKWLCGVIITWILYAGVFLLFYKGVDAAFVHFYHAGLNPLEVDFQKKAEAIQPFNYASHVAKTAYLLFGALTASMFVGSLYFNKVSFIKTGLIICAALVFLYVTNLAMAKLLFHNVSDAFPFSHVSIGLPQQAIVTDMALAIRPNNVEGGIRLPPPFIDIFRFAIRYVLAGTLCVTALIRLKEKEF